MNEQGEMIEQCHVSVRGRRLRGLVGRLPSAASRFLLVVVTALLVGSNTAAAHVILDGPTATSVAMGERVAIAWHIHIPHQTLNWDLHYSVSGPNGPWIPLVIDSPVVGTQRGVRYVHYWRVPPVVTTQLRIRVTQDNVGVDYQDMTGVDIEIKPSLAVAPESLATASGGPVQFSLDAGLPFAGRAYAVLGTTSGRRPGFRLLGATIPLNPDEYFATLARNASPFPFPGAFGALDATGKATVSLMIPPGATALVGLTAHHVWIALPDRPWLDVVSNAVSVSFIP